MSDSPVNLHRSMAGFLVANVLAIFVSSIVCLIAWQTTHPAFFKELHEYIQAKKELKKEKEAEEQEAKKVDQASAKKQKDNNGNDDKKDIAEKKDFPKDGEKENKKPDEKKNLAPPDAENKPPTKPDFPITVLGLTLLIDGSFCVLAGFVCVKIAGFARNNHGMLMALFVIVWKVQQLVGFVDNQLPASLLGIEIIALPIACIFGASLAGENDTEVESDEDWDEQAEEEE